MRHDLARQRNNLIVQRMAQGERAPDLASEYGLGVGYIYTLARNEGVRARYQHCGKLRRLAVVRELFSLGISNRSARELLGVSTATIANYSRDLGVKFPNGNRADGAGSKDRAMRMAAMYRAGMTLQEIGEKHGISRERVRQLMTKHLGMRQSGGGQAAKARMKSQRKKAEQDQRYLEKYGCTFDQYKELRELGKQMRAEGFGMYRTPIYAFFSQRNNAKYRGIDWNLTLWQWWTIWQESGKWSERGKRRDGYVMSRLMDQGAYELGNVYIGTLRENGMIQPNNPYRLDHPDHERFIKEMRERRNAETQVAA